MFNKSISTLSSNVSQIVKDSDTFATEDTKLIDVAGGKLAGSKLRLQLKNIDGDYKNYLIEFYNDRVVFGEDQNQNGKLDEAIEKAYNIIDEKNNFLTSSMTDEPTSLIKLHPNSKIDCMHI